MFRPLFLAALSVLSLALGAAASPPDTQAGRIGEVLRLPELLQVMAEEAVADAVPPGGGDPADGRQGAWLDSIARIYAPDRLMGMVETELARALARRDPQLIESALPFYESPAGRRLIALELSARRALLDADLAQAADDALHRAEVQRLPRLDRIDHLMEVTDIVEMNVVGGLNGYLEASRGFAAATGRADMLPGLTDEAWRQEETMRLDTCHWMRGLLLLAYAPLDDDDLEELIAFAQTPGAMALSASLHDAFQVVFQRVAFETGMVSGARFAGERL